jgi:hypothetical protein
MDIQWTHNMSWIQGNTIISMITARAYSQHLPPRDGGGLPPGGSPDGGPRTHGGG